jgi:hypothetical protein
MAALLLRDRRERSVDSMSMTLTGRSAGAGPRVEEKAALILITDTIEVVAGMRCP